MQSLMANRRSGGEHRFIRPDGKTIWLESHRSELHTSDRRFVGITQNVTQRKEAEARIALLMDELSHRLKNQYVVILALLRETSRKTDNHFEFIAAAEARIVALSRSHDLLVRGEWKGASIEELLKAQTEYFGSRDHFEGHGPVVRLSPHAAQYLGLAFHELATNATKHGSLSVPDGKVTVTWSCETNALKLEWRETGGPPASAAKHEGFGQKVLTQLAPAALKATAKLMIDARGAIWTLEAPVIVIEQDGEDVENSTPVSRF